MTDDGGRQIKENGITEEKEIVLTYLRYLHSTIMKPNQINKKKPKILSKLDRYFKS